MLCQGKPSRRTNGLCPVLPVALGLGKQPPQNNLSSDRWAHAEIWKTGHFKSVIPSGHLVSFFLNPEGAVRSDTKHFRWSPSVPLRPRGTGFCRDLPRVSGYVLKPLACSRGDAMSLALRTPPGKARRSRVTTRWRYLLAATSCDNTASHHHNASHGVSCHNNT